MPEVYDMSIDELRAAYITLEKRYASLGNAVTKQETKILELQAKNAVLEAQKVQWDMAKDVQNGMVQRHLSDKDAELQEMAQTIEELRAKLRGK